MSLKETKKLKQILHYCTFIYVGIVLMDGLNHPKQNTTMVKPLVGSSGMDMAIEIKPSW
jgi:hypothetical protein